MFETRKRTASDRKIRWSTFMRKFLIYITIIALVSTFSSPVFAAEKDEFSYSGDTYWATVKYGLNLRDKDGDIICYLESGTNVYVLGVSNDDTSRIVVEYGDTVGTVLKTGVNKIPTTGLTYSGKSYYGKVKYYLNVRNEKDNIIGRITKDEVVHVLGVYSKDSSRVVIRWNNLRGTVLKAGLVEVNYSGKSYYAVNQYGVNMRDTEGNLIRYIPKNSLLHVKGVYIEDNSRIVVEYNGREEMF